MLLKEKALADFIENNIDDAIESGRIRVFYQPIVRNLTKEVSSSEALARWSDPKMGLITPEYFIPTLEKTGQIHKLDCFMVEKVCQEMRRALNLKMPVIPTSINFSRLDFTTLDMLEFIEKTIQTYDIPRDFIHIEITESMIASDEEMMKRTINDFRNAGYEIWMDDFGSGYSSLNLLKDYDFDAIKLDMKFLSSINEKSKTILKHTLNMAKEIGVKTLAEGVENPEQVMLLEELGCGLLQGYYYGKPMDFDKYYDNLEELALPIERRKWRSYYDIASLNVKYTPYPLELIEYDKRNFKTLFMNDSFKHQIDCDGMSLNEIDEKIYQSGSPIFSKYIEFADYAIESGEEEVFYYSSRGNFYNLRGYVITENDGRYLIKGTIINMSEDENRNKDENIDYRLRELNHLFDSIYICNTKENTFTPLLGKKQYLKDFQYKTNALDLSFESFTDQFVYTTEKDRFRQFTDIPTIRARIEAGGIGYIQDIFRIRQSDGSYKWKEFFFMIVPENENFEYLTGIRSVSERNEKKLNEGTYLSQSNDKNEKTEMYSKLFENAIWNSSLKFFWKDKDRRFLGASKSFLEYYGMQSEKELIGKNDEDMHWHVNDAPYKNDEEEVISKGTVIKDSPGQCIINGVVHNILANKMPIYKDGKINGLLGFFIDSDAVIKKVNETEGSSSIDPITGLMSARGFVDVLMDYTTQYNDNGRNYGMIVLKNSAHSRIVYTYGKEYAEKVLKTIGETIMKVAGQTCAVARTKESYFAILTYVDNPISFDKLIDQVKAHVSNIKTVDGKSTTMRLELASVLRTDEGITDESIYETAISRISD